MKTIFSIDRFEGNIAVCISDDDEQFDLPREILGDMQAHDIFSAEVQNGALTDITPMPEERDRRLAANKARLQRLVNRQKGKKE